MKKRIKTGQNVTWQRKQCNIFTGQVLGFCPLNTAIKDAIDISKFNKLELTKINVNNNGIDRYLIYVINIGVVSVSASTIEKQNPDAERY